MGGPARNRGTHSNLVSVVLSTKILRLAVFLSCACSLYATFFLVDSRGGRYGEYENRSVAPADSTRLRGETHPRDQLFEDHAGVVSVVKADQTTPQGILGSRESSEASRATREGVLVGDGGFGSVGGAKAEEEEEEEDDWGSEAVELEPVILTIEPYHGPAAGGALITIMGHHLKRDDESEVKATVGGVPCLSTVPVDAETVVCETPPGAGDKQSVGVLRIGKDTQIETSPNTLFSYDAPRVSSIAPESGRTSGGNLVTILGDNFGPNRCPFAVLIGNLTCANATRRSDGEVTCSAPPQEAGPKSVSVVVGHKDHEVTSRPGPMYTYTLTPSERLKRESGRLLGGLSFAFDGTSVVFNQNANMEGREWLEKNLLTGEPVSYTVIPALREVVPRMDLERRQHGTCALVFNSDRLLSDVRGKAIDAHDAVFRFNNAPTEGFEGHVGSKTTYRFAQAKFLRALLERNPEVRGRVPRLGKDGALLVTAEVAQDFFVILKKTFAYSKMFYVSSSFVHNARSVYKELQNRFLEMGLALAEDDELAVGEHGRGLLGRGSSRAGGSDRFEDVASLEPRPELFEPPFGVLCTLFAMQLCKSVTAFGLADTVEGRTSPGARQPYYSSVSGEGVAVFDLDEVGRGATGHRGRVAGIDRAILRLLAMTQNLTLA
ncbi:sialyltransferase [Chloropicon roscoffensis]|uniref:Sialyltransferase n=1 Tax=Chloropicon roscoffensis TaxID=1461544 RepID=A0AAX4NZW7_9CHLO